MLDRTGPGLCLRVEVGVAVAVAASPMLTEIKTLVLSRRAIWITRIDRLTGAGIVILRLRRIEIWSSGRLSRGRSLRWIGDVQGLV